MNIVKRLRQLATIVPVAVLAVASMATAPVEVSAQQGRIRIVGSSTVYPFSSYVAEAFGQKTRFKTPIVESTGSGGGHKLFGAETPETNPSITNSSRAMMVSEFLRAQKNGIKNITEAAIGYDGIAVAQNVKNKPVNLTLKDITLAVAAEVPDPAGSGKLVRNPYKNWNEINPKLPNRPIKIYGPPTTSGTRDAFEELVLETATEEMKEYKEAYSKVRNDGPWIDAGENDNLIVQKLDKDVGAFGVFGYSFLEENRDKIQGATINGVELTPDNISSGKYPVSRSLFFYINNDHARKVPGLMIYVKMFMDEEMIGPKGQLKSIGLIPLPNHLRAASRMRVLRLTPLTIQNGQLSTLEDYAKKVSGK